MDYNAQNVENQESFDDYFITRRLGTLSLKNLSGLKYEQLGGDEMLPDQVFLDRWTMFLQRFRLVSTIGEEIDD